MLGRLYTIILTFVLIMLGNLPMMSQELSEDVVQEVDEAVVQRIDTIQAIDPDTLVVSLITCSPGTDLYAMFGHSAIRIFNVNTQQNIVFNYGMFNYNSDNFVFRFVKGETDYELGAEPADFFVWRYSQKGNGIVQQVLNLTPAEKAKLVALISENYKPENRIYRYNWLYDNCTTRARDIIEAAIDGEVVYTKSTQPKTARQILQEFTSPSPWSEFGINLLLGSEIDYPLSKKLQMFIPSYYEMEVDSAFIHRNGGGFAPLVLDKRTVLDERIPHDEPSIFTPFVVFSIMLLASCGLFLYERKKKVVIWVVDVVLLSLQGLAGILVSFLFFFSEHAAVDSNWLVVLFNPLPLIWLPYYINRAVKKRRDYVCYVSATAIVAFMVTMSVVRQVFDPSIDILAFILLTRTVSNIFNRKVETSLK